MKAQYKFAAGFIIVVGVLFSSRSQREVGSETERMEGPLDLRINWRDKA